MHKSQDERLRNQLTQQFGEKLGRLHIGDLARDPLAQHLFGKRGFEVHDQFHAPLVDQRIHRVAAHPQRHGALDAALRESQFTELLAHGLVVNPKRRPDVAQQKAVEVFDLRMRRDERRQRRAHRLYGVPQVGCEGVSVARGTRRGIGKPSRSDDDVRALLLAFETALVDIADAENLAAQGHNPGDARIVYDFDAVLEAIFQQGRSDVPRLAAPGKDPFAALDFELHARPLEEADGSAVVELGEGRREKLRIGPHLRGELLGRAGVGDVAAALARDADLAARFLHLLDEQHTFSIARGGSCGHHARSPRTDDDDVVRYDLFFFQLLHTTAKIGNNSFFTEKFFYLCGR